MALALDANFGSVGRWREEFVAMANAHAVDSGWVLLMFQTREGALVNQWAADHTHIPAGSVPILALDMDKHSRPMVFDAATLDYVDAFMDNISWAEVYPRYQAAVHHASEPFGAARDDVAGALLLDVRRAGAFAQATAMIPGATWRDPALVAHWSNDLPTDREVIVYCVYGHEVGRATAMRLRAAGVKARYLQGGIDAWQAAGEAISAKGAES